MRRILLFIPLSVLLPAPSHAFWWVLTEQEQIICERRASREQTGFSAKQAYERCKKGIRSELEQKKKDDEERKRQLAKKKEEAAAAAVEFSKRLQTTREKCLKALPEWDVLEKERKEHYEKYSRQTKTFRTKMTKLYGPDYDKLSNGGAYSDYPDYVLNQFPWIKWYVELYAKQDAFLARFASPAGSANDYLSQYNSARWIFSAECKHDFIKYYLKDLDAWNEKQKNP